MDTLVKSPCLLSFRGVKKNSQHWREPEIPKKTLPRKNSTRGTPTEASMMITIWSSLPLGFRRNSMAPLIRSGMFANSESMAQNGWGKILHESIRILFPRNMRIFQLASYVSWSQRVTICVYIYIPRCSMYGLFTYIFSVVLGVNVGKYSSPIEHLGYIYPGSPKTIFWMVFP